MKKIKHYLIIIISLLFFSCSYYNTPHCYNMNEKNYKVNHTEDYYIVNKKIIKEKKDYRKYNNKLSRSIYKKQQKPWNK